MRRRLGWISLLVLATTLAAIAGASAAMRAAPTKTSDPTISGTLQQGQTLTATSGGWDQASLTFAYQWKRCPSSGSCSAISGATNQTYTLVGADVGDNVEVVVTATNTSGDSGTATSAQRGPIVAASAPVNASKPTISGTARDRETLTASPGSWTGTQPISYSYQWQRCSSAGASCGNVAGADHQTYTLGSADVGHTLRVLVTATNSGGSSAYLSDPSGVVAPLGTAPANKGLPTISGSLAPGQTLTANDGSWAGTGPFSFAYVWYRCDGAGNHCGAIKDATHKTYGVGTADVGHTLRVLVTASDPAGKANAMSKQTGVVGGAPALLSIPSFSGDQRQGATLSGNDGKWASSSPIAYYPQWIRCDGNVKSCGAIPGATSLKYTLTSGDVGHRLFLQVKAQNKDGAAWANSNPTGVVAGQGGTAPAAGAIAIKDVNLPDRLVVSSLSFTPSRITTRRTPLVGRFRITDTNGHPVAGALVYVVGVPFARLSQAKEVATDGNGWATISFTITNRLAIRRGNLLVMFVRARKPGGDLLAGVSTRRLVSVRVG